MANLSNWLWNLVYGSGAVFASALFLLYWYQERLMYIPDVTGASRLTSENPPGFRSPSEFNVNFEDLMMRTKDGVQIHTWLLKQPNAGLRPTIVFFHGNAGNIGFRLPNAIQMFRFLKCNILLVDYRGYGHSEGNPTEDGIKLDAEAVLETIKSRQDIDTSRIFVFGRSLGGAVAVYLAAKHPTEIAGVILENTFLSIPSMVDQLMPYLSGFKRLVLRMEWNSEQVIAKIQVPILFVAGARDELVPHAHMKKLYELAQESNKRTRWHVVRNGTHNDTWLRGGEKYYQVLAEFLDGIERKEEEQPDTCDPQEQEQHETNDVQTSIPSMLEQPLIQELVHRSKH